MPIARRACPPPCATRLSSSVCYALVQHSHSLLNQEFDIFFSHAWADKFMMIHVYKELAKQGFHVWFDVNEMGYDLDISMREGIAKSKVVVCCLNTKYQNSKNCMFELEQSKKQGKPVIGLFIEDGFYVKASSEVQDFCEFGPNHPQGKMFCDIGKIAADKGWASDDGPSLPLLQSLQKKIKDDLVKTLDVVARFSRCLISQLQENLPLTPLTPLLLLLLLLLLLSLLNTARLSSTIQKFQRKTSRG